MWLAPNCSSAACVVSSFITEASYDKLFVFNGPSTAAPKLASTNGAGFGNTTYGTGGWWGNLNTNLPGPFYAWYLRNFYLENNLVQPGKLTVCGEKMDLGQLTLPVYIYGSREDHIVPINAAYASTQVLPGKKRFVMGASGHIAGVINPPAKNKRSHWIRADGKLPATLEQWLSGATEHAGSWWTDWSQWLKAHAGKQIATPKAYGKGAKFKAMEPAPGRDVKQKS